MNTEKRKRIIFAIITVFLSFVFACSLAEISLRIILPKIEPTYSVKESDPLLKPDPILGHRLKPNKDLGIDKNGFKNDKILSQYPIVALGDSHTLGGLSKESRNVSWPKYLSDILKIPVYNMGVHGYGVAQYYYLLDKALEFRPKIILVGLYLGNDIYNAYDIVYHKEGWNEFRSSDFIDNNPITSAEQKQVHIFLRPIRDWLRNKSVLYKFLSNRTRVWREKLGLATPRYTGVRDWSYMHPDVSYLYDDNPKIKTLFWARHRLQGVDLADKNTQEGLRLSLRFLSLMNKKIVQHQAKMVVVFIPDKHLAYAEQVGEEKIKQNDYFKKIIKYEQAIKQVIIDQADKEGYNYIDVLPYLQKALKQGKKVYPETMNGHPLPAGYKLYAQAVADYLQKNDLID